MHALRGPFTIVVTRGTAMVNCRRVLIDRTGQTILRHDARVNELPANRSDRKRAARTRRQRNPPAQITRAAVASGAVAVGHARRAGLQRLDFTQLMQRPPSPRSGLR